MSGLDKDRKRNQTISFHMSVEERKEFEARVAITGLSKVSYIIQSLLYQKVNITAGKYQSDRLSLELRRLGAQLENIESEDIEIMDILLECKLLLGQLNKVINEE